jgi:thiamine-phosphate pyrophosphorylase
VRAEVPRLYAIADAASWGPAGLVEAYVVLAEAGVGWIQTRWKGGPDREVWRACEAIAAWRAGVGSARQPPARWWVNDRADLASMAGADGVHLGQRDLPVAAARAAIGAHLWVGRSTHDRAEVDEAAADPAVDVIAVGPVYETRSKPDAHPVVGLDLVRWARGRTEKPLVAIGGIDASNADAVLAAGADAVAVLGAVSGRDAGANARRLVEALAGRPGASPCAST